MLDFGNALITWGRDMRTTLLKMCIDWMIFLTMLAMIKVKESLVK